MRSTPDARAAQPTVRANLALRLLQVHLCVVYLFSGCGKLLGASWWEGTALWGAAANVQYRTLDLRWLAPLPIEQIKAHAKACGRVLIVDECRATNGGACAAVAASAGPGLIGGLIVGSGFAKDLADLAALHPTTSFVLVGGTFEGVLGATPANVRTITFTEQDGAFMMGVAAALA